MHPNCPPLTAFANELQNWHFGKEVTYSALEITYKLAEKVPCPSRNYPKRSWESVPEARPETLKLQTLKICSAKSFFVGGRQKKALGRRQGEDEEEDPSSCWIRFIGHHVRKCFEEYFDALCVENPAKIWPKDWGIRQERGARRSIGSFVVRNRESTLMGNADQFPICAICAYNYMRDRGFDKLKM
jgi:hypothetical protein